MHGGLIPPHDGRGTLHLTFAISSEDLDPWRQTPREAGIALESEATAYTSTTRTGI